MPKNKLKTMKIYKISDFPNSGNVQEVQTSYKKRPSAELIKIKDSKEIEAILTSENYYSFADDCNLI